MSVRGVRITWGPGRKGHPDPALAGDAAFLMGSQVALKVLGGGATLGQQGCNLQMSSDIIILSVAFPQDSGMKGIPIPFSTLLGRNKQKQLQVGVTGEPGYEGGQEGK